MGEPADTWALATAYEPYMGRWSRLVAAEFVAWLGNAGDDTWLDVGCGTGALSQTVLAAADPALVLGVDPSVGFLARAPAQLDGARARFAAADARRRRPVRHRGQRAGAQLRARPRPGGAGDGPGLGGRRHMS